MTTALIAALANSLVLGSLVAGAVTVVLRLAPRRILNAATRYAIWWITLGITIAVPVMRLPLPTMVLPHWAPPTPSVGTVVTPYIPPVSEGTIADQSSDRDILGLSAHPQPKGRGTGPKPIFAVPAPENRWPLRILEICGVLSAIMLLRLVVSCILLERTKSRAALAPSSQAVRVARWLTVCGSRRGNIRLKISSKISCPIATGPIHAAILVPSSFFEDLSDEEIDQAGVHEAAHLARRDDYALLLQRAIEAVLCWHPAVRWITRQIDLEREIACDDFVVQGMQQPRSYASCLTRLAELASRQRPSLVAAGAIAKGTHLTQRVELLLDRTRHTGTRLLRFRLAGVALVPLVLALCATRIPEVVAFASPSPAQPQSTAPARPAATAAPSLAPAQALPKPQDPAPDPAADQSIAQWIKANAIPLTTVEAGNGFADMQPLKKIVGNARVVVLGDATLGTHEFYQLKHRMVEFLASQMGFTVFCITENMPEAYRLNDYVLNGNGDPAELLKGMYFWTSDTREVLDMIQWMRDFNKSGRGHIEFTGVDMQVPTVAGKIVREFAGKYDADYLPVIQKAPYAQGEGPRPFASDTGTFPVADAAGKTVRFSANIKTQDVTEYAGLWWRADGPKDGKLKSIAFQNLGTAAPKGTTGWKRYELELVIPAEAKNINFGVLLAGGGTAWFDGLEVQIDGQPYTKVQGFDLLQKAKSKGNFLMVSGYAGTFESNESSGAAGPALQLRRTAPIDPESANRPKEATAKWRDILDHMESSRTAYLGQGGSPKDVDWAIQNARVVLQSIQLKSSEITRDRAMADNLKWILDHSPSDTRIVVWTHNEHASKQAPGAYKPMAVELRETYGSQLVSFGFAFNQGSFRSIEMGTGLRSFAVPPAEDGSFDATLAASGIPLFALDLQHATGAAAAWLNQPHKTRSIGPPYSEDRSYLDLVAQPTFDAVLFVESTTASVATAELASAGIVSCTGAGQQICRDKEYAVSFTLPEGWSVHHSLRWGNMENTVALIDPQAIPGQMHPSLWYTVRSTPEKRTPAETTAALQKWSTGKVIQRQQGGLSDYHLRPNSCHARNVGSLPGWSCIGEFTDSSGRAMAEYLTWTDSGNAGAEFFGVIPASGLNSYMTRFDAIIETLKIP